MHNYKKLEAKHPDFTPWEHIPTHVSLGHTVFDIKYIVGQLLCLNEYTHIWLKLTYEIGMGEVIEDE